MHHLRVTHDAFALQWTELLRGGQFFVGFVVVIPLAVLVGLIASRSDVVEATYLVFGMGLLTFFSRGIVRVGALVFNENHQGTFELMILAPVTMTSAMLGKALALSLHGLLMSIVSVVVVIVIGEVPILIANRTAGVITLMLSVFAVVMTNLIIAPIVVLARGRRGVFNGINPFVVAFGGFLYPVSIFPSPIQEMALIFPTAWTSSALLSSIEGTTLGNVAVQWLGAVAVCLTYLVGSYYFFAMIESRLLANGDIGTP